MADELEKAKFALSWVAYKREEFDYEIEYKISWYNTNTDTLSRVEIHINKLQKCIEEFNAQLDKTARNKENDNWE